MNNNSSLLIIDAQVNMFDEAMPVHQADEILTKLVWLKQQAQKAGIPIIFVRHDGGKGEVDEFGSDGWQVHPQLLSAEQVAFIEKKKPDSFEGTQLQETLQSNGISQIIIAGMQTDQCIQATVRQAASRGYDVTLISNAHSTFDSDDKTASEIISEHNAMLANFAKLEIAEAVQF